MSSIPFRFESEVEKISNFVCFQNFKFPKVIINYACCESASSFLPSEIPLLVEMKHNQSTEPLHSPLYPLPSACPNPIQLFVGINVNGGIECGLAGGIN